MEQDGQETQTRFYLSASRNGKKNNGKMMEGADAALPTRMIIRGGGKLR